MSRPPDPHLARRLAEIVAYEFRHAIQPHVDFDDLLGFAGEGVAVAMARWDGRGVLEAFVIQRARWAVLNGLRRHARKASHAHARDDLLAAAVTQGAAEANPSPSPSLDGPPSGPPVVPEMVGDAAAAYDLALDAAASHPSADDVERDAERMKLRRAMTDLPPPMPDILQRHYYMGETFDETAEALGMKRSTVFDIHGRAVKALRARLGADPPAG